MFFNQHFGSIAIGWSNADLDLRAYRQARGNDPKTPFFQVTSEGVSYHPWKHKKDEIRIALVGLNLYFEEEYNLRPQTELFAKVEYGQAEVYLRFQFPDQVVEGDGLPDPSQLSEDILRVAVDRINGKQNQSTHPIWVVVDKRQIRQKKIRTLLGKVCKHIESCVRQNGNFFTVISDTQESNRIRRMLDC